MARYFFNVIDGMFLADNVGEELATREQAQDRAVARAKETIDQYGPNFWHHDGVRIVVTDVEGLALFDLMVVGRVLSERTGPLEQR